MKKAIIVLSTIYLTSCGIAKPVVLTSAQMKPLKTIQKVYTNTNTRNGASDIEIIKSESGRIAITSTSRIDYYLELYVTPYNNPLYFKYADDENSTSEDGNYRSFDTTLFFQTKASCRFWYRDLTRPQQDIIQYFERSATMTPNTSEAAINTKVFKMYKLPFNTEYRNITTGNSIFSYIYSNTLETYENSETRNIIINPYEYKYNVYANYVAQGQLYYRHVREENIADYLPPLEDPNANRLQTYYYYDFLTLGALNLDWYSKITSGSFPLLAQHSQEIQDTLLDFFECNQGSTGHLTYQYNASLSEELSAFNDGYTQGIEEADAGVGTSRIQNVFRAIQSFLNIDFGFFKLAHVLGGMLVIAIVIFIVRWFR